MFASLLAGTLVTGVINKASFRRFIVFLPRKKGVPMLKSDCRHGCRIGHSHGRIVLLFIVPLLAVISSACGWKTSSDPLQTTWAARSTLTATASNVSVSIAYVPTEDRVRETPTRLSSPTLTPSSTPTPVAPRSASPSPRATSTLTPTGTLPTSFDCANGKGVARAGHAIKRRKLAEDTAPREDID